MNSLKKIANGFTVLDWHGMPVGTIEVGQQWKDNTGFYIIEILSFDTAKESFECSVFDTRYYHKSISSIQDPLNFYQNYKLDHKAAQTFRTPISNSTLTIQEVLQLSKATDQPKREAIITCECGAHKLGAKNYSRQHSSWCPVYKE